VRIGALVLGVCACRGALEEVLCCPSREMRAKGRMLRRQGTHGTFVSFGRHGAITMVNTGPSSFISMADCGFRTRLWLPRAGHATAWRRVRSTMAVEGLQQGRVARPGIPQLGSPHACAMASWDLPVPAAAAEGQAIQRAYRAQLCQALRTQDAGWRVSRPR